MQSTCLSGTAVAAAAASTGVAAMARVDHLILVRALLLVTDDGRRLEVVAVGALVEVASEDVLRVPNPAALLAMGDVLDSGDVVRVVVAPVLARPPPDLRTHAVVPVGVLLPVPVAGRPQVLVVAAARSAAAPSAEAVPATAAVAAPEPTAPVACTAVVEAIVASPVGYAAPAALDLSKVSFLVDLL